MDPPPAKEKNGVPLPSVLVATPLVGRDALLVAGWTEAIDRVAAANPGARFVRVAAVREKDTAALEACAAARVEAVTVRWYDLPGGAHGKNPCGLMLKRVRLIRYAAEKKIDIVWFVNVDVRVPPGCWAHVGALHERGIPVVCVPYPTRWHPQHAPVVFKLAGSGRVPAVEIHDARTLVAAPPPAPQAAVIAGGGFGCISMYVPVAGLVGFICPEYALEKGGPGSEIGWFFNAAKARVAIHMAVGVQADHVGCTPGPI